MCSPWAADVGGRVLGVEGGKRAGAAGWRGGRSGDKGARWNPAELSEVVDALIDEAVPPQKVYGT